MTVKSSTNLTTGVKRQNGMQTAAVSVSSQFLNNMPERMFEQQLVWLTVSVISGRAHLSLWHLVVGEHGRGGRSPPCYLENKELEKENSRTQPQWLNFLRRSPPLPDIITSCWHHSGRSKPSIWGLWRTF